MMYECYLPENAEANTNQQKSTWQKMHRKYFEKKQKKCWQRNKVNV